MDNTYTVLLLDSQILVRKAISRLINSLDNFRLEAEASNSAEAISILESKPIDVVVLEIALEGPSGIELLHELTRSGRRVNSVVLSSMDAEHMVNLALAAGATSFIPKSCGIEDLQNCLLSTAKGERYLPQNLEHLRKVTSTPNTQLSFDPLAPLSTREREIFHLLADGMQNASIAKKLFISPRTVETHRARVVRKLGLNSNAELIRFAIKWGLSVVAPGEPAR